MALTFTSSIRLANAAMLTPLDLGEALKNLATDMERHTAGDPYEPIEMTEHTVISGSMFDVNGNTVGTWNIVPETPPPTEAELSLETRQAMFGRGVAAIMDGTECGSDELGRIGELASALNIIIRPPFDDEEA